MYLWSDSVLGSVLLYFEPLSARGRALRPGPLRGRHGESCSGMKARHGIPSAKQRPAGCMRTWSFSGSSPSGFGVHLWGSVVVSCDCERLVEVVKWAEWPRLFGQGGGEARVVCWGFFFLIYVVSTESQVKVRSGETLTLVVKFLVAVIDCCFSDFSVAGRNNSHHTFGSGSRRKTVTALLVKLCFESNTKF